MELEALLAEAGDRIEYFEGKYVEDMNYLHKNLQN